MCDRAVLRLLCAGLYALELRLGRSTVEAAGLDGVITMPIGFFSSRDTTIRISGMRGQSAVTIRRRTASSGARESECLRILHDSRLCQQKRLCEWSRFLNGETCGPASLASRSNHEQTQQPQSPRYDDPSDALVVGNHLPPQSDDGPRDPQHRRVPAHGHGEGRGGAGLDPCADVRSGPCGRPCALSGAVSRQCPSPTAKIVTRFPDARRPSRREALQPLGAAAGSCAR
jgi:hypothetical protein